MEHDTPPLTSGDVARIFSVTKTTVKRWADDGHLASFKTPGGHYRFRQIDVDALKAKHETTGVGAA